VWNEQDTNGNSTACAPTSSRFQVGIREGELVEFQAQLRRHAGIHVEFTTVRVRRGTERIPSSPSPVPFLPGTRQRTGSPESAWQNNIIYVNEARRGFARGFPQVNPPFAGRSSRSGPSDRQVHRRDRLQPRAASFARGVQLGESVFAVLYLDIFASSSPCFYPSFSFCRRSGIDDRPSSALGPTMRDSRRLRTA